MRLDVSSGHSNGNSVELEACCGTHSSSTSPCTCGGRVTTRFILSWSWTMACREGVLVSQGVAWRILSRSARDGRRRASFSFLTSPSTSNNIPSRMPFSNETLPAGLPPRARRPSNDSVEIPQLVILCPSVVPEAPLIFNFLLRR